VGKGVYINGQEKPDVVFYRQQSFLPCWKELKKQMSKWLNTEQLDNTSLPPGEHPLMHCAYNQYIFYSNDRIHYCWVYKDKHHIHMK